MRLTTKKIIAIAVALLLVGGSVAYLNGWITLSSKDTHPPCEQLPTVAEAALALENNQDLAEEIKALGDGIAVEVGEVCPDNQDRGLIKVSYATKSEHNSIADLLSRREGFGVPVHLEKR
ncbi:MAG: hypothetical protein ACI4XL_02865 [Bacillus sp. (in: firmicutes)]